MMPSVLGTVHEIQCSQSILKTRGAQSVSMLKVPVLGEDDGLGMLFWHMINLWIYDTELCILHVFKISN